MNVIDMMLLNSLKWGKYMTLAHTPCTQIASTSRCQQNHPGSSKKNQLSMYTAAPFKKNLNLVLFTSLPQFYCQSFKWKLTFSVGRLPLQCRCCIPWGKAAPTMWVLHSLWEGCPSSAGVAFSVGRLPLWCRCHVLCGKAPLQCRWSRPLKSFPTTGVPTG